jgi:hypothetical protein
MHELNMPTISLHSVTATPGVIVSEAELVTDVGLLLPEV